MDEERLTGEEELTEEEKLAEEEKQESDAQEKEKQEKEKQENERKRAEAIAKVKDFLLENKDILILSGQLALVVLVCAAGIKNDLIPDGCCKKCRKKKKKRK